MHRDHRSDRKILLDIERRLETVEGMVLIMARNFAALAAAVALIGTEIDTAVSILQNPDVDNNDQATIDDLTSKLTAAADALKGALPAEVTDAGSGSDTGGTTTGSDTSGSSDQSSAGSADTGTGAPGESAPIPASGAGSETHGQVDQPISE